MPLSWKTIAWFLVGGFIAACAPLQGAPPVVERQTVEAIPPGVSEAEVTAGGVAVLDPLPQTSTEGLRDSMAFEIFQGLRTGFPKAAIRSRPDSDAALVQAGLQSQTSSFFKEYPRRRHIDWDLMARVGEAEKVRYLFVSRIEKVGKRTDVRMLDQGEKMVGGKVSVFSSGPSMIAESVEKDVRFYGELLDVRCRAVVWTGNGGTSLTEPAGEERLRVEDLLIAAGRLLVGSLQQSLKPTGKKETC